jgi:hypothetical protein
LTYSEVYSYVQLTGEELTPLTVKKMREIDYLVNKYTDKIRKEEAKNGDGKSSTGNRVQNKRR